MILADVTLSPRVTQVLNAARRFSADERLILAKLLLDSLVADEASDAADWQAMGLAAFERDWNNSEDAVYDDWRALCGVRPG